MCYSQVPCCVKCGFTLTKALGIKQHGTMTSVVRNFSNARKKSLAFISKVGVASASVQGLEFAQSSLDGEAMREIQEFGLERFG